MTGDFIANIKKALLHLLNNSKSSFLFEGGLRGQGAAHQSRQMAGFDVQTSSILVDCLAL